MKTLDRYIVRNFLISALLCIVVLMSLRIMADLFVNMDEFVKNKGDVAGKTVRMIAEDIVTYYAYQSPVYFRQMGGVMMVAAAAFALWRMNHTNELTAMLASGVSLHRVLLPIVLCSMGLNLAILLDGEYLIPQIKYELTRDPSEVTRRNMFQVVPVSDNNDNAWVSPRFSTDDGIMSSPLVIFRGPDYAWKGHISAPKAQYDAAGQCWVFHPGTIPVLDRRRDVFGKQEPRPAVFCIDGWPLQPTTDFIPSATSPEAIWQRVATGPAGRGIDLSRQTQVNLPKGLVESPLVPTSRMAPNLVVRGKLVLKEAGKPAAGATLENPSFTYTDARGRELVSFVADRAVYAREGQFLGWALTNATIRYTCDLTPQELTLRQSGNWLQFMSTAELGRLLKLKRTPNPEEAMLARHARFADFFNNLLMLLVSVPFILSRERNIKASAGLTVLMTGVVFVFVYLTRQLGLSPALAAWLPILVFGPVSAVMVESVKT